VPDTYWVLERGTGSLYAIDVATGYPGDGTLPEVIWLGRAGGTVVWSEQRSSSEWVIVAAPTADLTPATTDLTLQTDPSAMYFPETGHAFWPEMRAFWERNGGLSVLGYPLTDEYVERNRDTDRWHTVQFTERQRLELHPENAETPYAVLLGRLGYEQAVRLRLLDDEPFLYQYRDPSLVEDRSCSYLVETGHTLCGDFRAYWEAHGLDLGDDGVSFRESLALFGFPISEAFMTTNADGDTVQTQYFERAVFELHPDNPAEWRVLLRRLGAELLHDRGW
jgi:hypothetical protein